MSHEPLKPVCPVINTFFLFQKDDEVILPDLPWSVIIFP
ncbi:Prespore-specific transcriptional regulator rsfA [Bacillus cereus Rock4-18]|nr:Prespore-specific transcriptional regulator rsfA [Bacillus cereus Rock4-18]